MRLGITARLFLTIFAVCIAVAIAMGIAVRVSLQVGFDEYVQEREARRVAILSEALGEIYRDTGGWRIFRDEPRRWWRTLRSAPDDHAPANPGERPRGYSPPPPYYLTDVAGQVVAGTPADGSNESTPRHPILVDGQTVGWLVRQPRGPAPDAIDERFLAQQLKATWIISALSLVLAALVSVLLARSLLAPVRRLGHATHRLAAGDYATRVDVTSRDELGRLAEDFNRLALTLEKNEQLRRDMMADISHELRTPLAILHGELEALQDGVRSLTPASLESLQAEVATLSKLIEDLYVLSLADIGALHYRMTRVDVAGLLRAACSAFRERLADRDIRLDLALPDQAPTIEGDPQRLTQLFNNLLENSLRYTDPGGVVRVRLEHDANQLHVVLCDSAPGVPEALLPRLFERLFRADSSRSREGGGSGLGLAICQRIAEAHGATIVARPSELGGICVVLTLALYRH